MRVFVDSSAWIALANRQDIHHAEARAVFAHLLAERAALVTSNYVLAETLTWLRYRMGPAAAVSFQDSIEASLAQHKLAVLWIDEACHREAVELMRRWGEHPLSVTDCTSFVLIRREGLQALAFDRHFELAGVELVRPSALG